MRSKSIDLGATFVLALLWCAPLTASAQQPSLPSQPGGSSTDVAGTANVPAVPEEAPTRRAGEEEITVTGSRVRRKDLTTPAPVTVFTRQQIEESGRATIGEFLQLLPEQGNAPNFQLNNGGVTYSADGSTRINLRSLGITRTLVLVNGRRMVPAGVGASPTVDLNTIPAAAVENIEVLKDGASAIYGSDAIAGVVNIITRKSFNGTQASVQYGVSRHGDANTLDASVTTGFSGTAGNFIFSGGYFKQDESWLRDRSWSANALTFDYKDRTTTPGGSFRTPQGTLGLPASAGTDPNCQNNPTCRAIVSAFPNSFSTDSFIHCDVRDPTCNIRDPSTGNLVGFRRLDEKTDLYNFASDNYLTIPSERLQVYASGDTRILGNAARPYFEASYVQRTTSQNAAPMPLNPGDFLLPGTNTEIAMSPNSFYNPIRGVEPAFAGRRLVEFGNRLYKQDLGTFHVVGGVDGTLPDELGPVRGWYWDTSINYGRTSGTFTTDGSIRNSRIADAVGPSFQLPSGQVVCGNPGPDGIPGTADDVIIPGCVPLNLFGGPNNGSISPSQIGSLGFEGTSRALDELFSVNLNTTGELFRISADRPIALALGYEFRRQSGEQIADPIAASGDSADFNFQSTAGHYTANEVYGELSIPLLANLPGIQTLDASVAGRYVHYSTFGDDFSYKLGGRYTPIQDITLRGTYSTAFRAPTVNELFLGQSDSSPTAVDPCGTLAGASPALRQQCTAPPTGNVAPTPAAGSGDQSNQINSHVGGNPNLQAETARIWTVGVVVQPRLLANLSITVDYYDISVDNLVSTIGVPTILAGCYPGDTGTPNPRDCALINRVGQNSRIVFVSDVNQNVGSLSTAGVDFAIRYALPTELGRFGVGFDATYLEHYDRNGVSGAGNYDLGALPHWKFNAGLNWRLGGWSASTLVRYVGTFTECSTPGADPTSAGGLCSVRNTDPTVQSREVGHNTTMDLNASYTLRSSFGRTLVMVGMNNVFDQRPQFVYSAPLANSDASVYDFVGRYIYFRAQHTF
jgi:iron complex outermembrane receptor protein